MRLCDAASLRIVSSFAPGCSAKDWPSVAYCGSACGLSWDGDAE